MELVRELEGVLGVTATIDRRPAQPGDVSQTWARIDKAKRLLGYEPATASRTACATLPVDGRRTVHGAAARAVRLHVSMAAFDAVLVISFGGPQGLDDIRPFLANVLRGRRVAPAARRGSGASLRAASAACRRSPRSRSGRPTVSKPAFATPAQPLPVYVGHAQLAPVPGRYAAPDARGGRAPRARLHRRGAALLLELPAVSRERGGRARRTAAAGRRRGRDVRRQLVRSPGLHRAPMPRTCVRRGPGSTQPSAGRRPAGLHGAQHSRAHGAAFALRGAAHESARLVAQAAETCGLGAGLPEPQRPPRGSVAWARMSGTICVLRRRTGCRPRCCARSVSCAITSRCSTISIRRRRQSAARLGCPMVRAEAVNDDPRFLDMMADMVRRTVRRYESGRALPLAP